MDDSINTKILNMIHASDNVASDDIMAELDPLTGPLVVSNDLKNIGLVNTFMAGFFKAGSDILQRFDTPANQRTDILTQPDVYSQTTSSDMGMLLEDIYQCSETGGGALIAAYSDKMNKDVCRKIINYLEQDKIGVLLEAGVPEGTQVAMKHGWVNDVRDNVLHDVSAAGIVYTPGGNFVLSAYTYHPVQNSIRCFKSADREFDESCLQFLQHGALNGTHFYLR